MIILVEWYYDDEYDVNHSKVISVFDNFKQLRSFLDDYQGEKELRWEIWSVGKQQPDQVGDINRVELPRVYRYEMRAPKNRGGWDRDFDPSSFVA